MKVRFKNPPINELIIGTYFDPQLLALRNEHIGLLWSRLRNEFPTVEQREPLLNPAPDGQGLIVPLPMGNEFFMPRFWFISEDKTNLLQVQKNAFLLNWRRQKTETEYPHFAEHLKPNFDKYFGIFEEFLQEDVGVADLKIGLCELTYVDVIEPCDYWQGPQDTSGLIPSFTIPNCELTQDALPPTFNCMYHYVLAPDLQLHVTVRCAKATNEPDSPRLILEFRALGPLGGVPKSDTETWYEQAHDAIVDWFLNMTDKEVQRTYWILEEGTE